MTGWNKVLSIFAENFFRRRRISPIPLSPKVNFAEDDFRRFHFRRNEFFPENHLK
jgi:hypothetical protein